MGNLLYIVALVGGLWVMIGADASKVVNSETIIDENPVIAQMIERQHLAAKEWAAANTATTGSFTPGSYTAYDDPWGLAHCMDDEAGNIATYDNGNLGAKTPSYVITQLNNSNPTFKAGYYEDGNVVFSGTTLAAMPINCPALTNGTLVLVSLRVEGT